MNNQQTVNCISCQSLLNMANDSRKSGGYTGVCSNKECSLMYLVIFNKLGEVSFTQNIQKRFSSNKQIWHLTYHPKIDQSTFILIEKRYKSEQITQRKEYKLSGLVLPERFLNLLSFL